MKQLNVLILILLLVGCTLPNPPTSTTLPPVPTDPATEIPPSPTGLPTPEPEPVQVQVALPNPGFEGRFVDGYGGLVPDGWQGWACEGCPALDGRTTDKPEFTLIFARDYPNRIFAGDQAVKMIGTWKVMDGGLYTDFETPEGATTCDVSAWVHGWSAHERSEYYYAKDGPLSDLYSRSKLGDLRETYAGYGRVGFRDTGEPIWDGVPYTSDRATADDKRALSFYLGTGPINANPAIEGSVTYSDPFTYQELEDGAYTVYDNYTKITAGLPAFDEQTRLVIRTVNIWGLTHNDRYLDDVSVVCNVPAPEPTLTPEPSGTVEPSQEPPKDTPTPVPSGTPIPDDQCEKADNVTYVVVSNGLNIRKTPQLNGQIVGSMAQGVEFQVTGIYAASPTEGWAGLDGCGGARWVAIELGGTKFSEPKFGEGG